MGPAMGLVLRCLLLLAPGGLRLSHGQVQLEGVGGEAVYFPALRPVARDIVRILWFSGRQGTHIAEAKPQAQKFNVNYLPYFSNRLAIHAGNLSLEMRELRLEDQGTYRAVVDIASDPTHPQTFSYGLAVRGHQQKGKTTTGPPGRGERRTTMGPPGREGWRTTTGPPGRGERRTTMGPPGREGWRTTTGPPGREGWRTTTGPPGRGERRTTTGPPGGGERRTTTGPPGGGGRPVGGDPVTAGGSRGRTTLAGGDGDVPGGGENRVLASCHCALKGYLIAAVYGPLCIVVAIVHVKTRC